MSESTDEVLMQNFTSKKSTYLPSNLPKPTGKKFSTKVPVGKKGTTIQPVKMGKGLGAGVKVNFKLK
tara:strand:+ start:618 stop:818 length:201 start_codon:yes stop_codon:yes gene_type:complete